MGKIVEAGKKIAGLTGMTVYGLYIILTNRDWETGEKKTKIDKPNKKE